MKKTDINKLLSEQGNKVAVKIAEVLIKNPKEIPEIMQNLYSENPKIKYGSSKALFLISEEKPNLLYKYFDTFTELMDGENSFLKWSAIAILMNFSFTDKERKIDSNFCKKILDLIENDSMITAGHVVSNIWKFAANGLFPTDDIITKILSYKNRNISAECNNILAGHIIDSFPKIYDMLSATNKKEVMTFALKHIKNKRTGTQKKAKMFLKSFS